MLTLLCPRKHLYLQIAPSLSRIYAQCTERFIHFACFLIFSFIFVLIDFVVFSFIHSFWRGHFVHLGSIHFVHIFAHLHLQPTESESIAICKMQIYRWLYVHFFPSFYFFHSWNENSKHPNGAAFTWPIIIALPINNIFRFIIWLEMSVNIFHLDIFNALFNMRDWPMLTGHPNKFMRMIKWQRIHACIWVRENSPFKSWIVLMVRNSQQLIRTGWRYLNFHLLPHWTKQRQEGANLLLLL